MIRVSGLANRRPQGGERARATEAINKQEVAKPGRDKQDWTHDGPSARMADSRPWRVQESKPQRPIVGPKWIDHDGTRGLTLTGR